MATAMAVHGHGLAGSGEARPRRVRLSSGRASGVHYQANQAQRRGWEGRGGSWPRGAPTPARSHHGGGGGNGEYALTKPQTTWLRGGGGGEEHSEATNELADVFLRWRARTTTVTCGRQWRSCCSVVVELQASGGKENGAGESVGRRTGFSCHGQQRQDAHGTWPARAECR